MSDPEDKKVDESAFDDVEVSEVTPTPPGLDAPSQTDLDRAALQDALTRITKLETRVNDMAERVQGVVAVETMMRQFKRLRKYLAAWLGETG